MIKKLSMAVCFAMVFAAGSAYAKKEKVDVCHVPPDNPTNAHIISIPLKASLAHIWHGDLSPGAQESGIYCDDGIDNDCDGDTDAADASCAPPPDACLEAGGTRVDGLEGCYFLGQQ